MRHALLLEKVVGELRKHEYILADTRVPTVRLYDHLLMTAGIAVALFRELRLRGMPLEAIAGRSVGEETLRRAVWAAALLHDVGKARLGVTEYRLHTKRSLDYAQEVLAGWEAVERELVLGAIARHHLRDGPQTPMEKLVCLADSYASAADRPELARGTSTRGELERAVQATLALERELFGGDPPLRLLMGDADAIKAYVYESSKLPDIRGGSQLLQEAEEDVKRVFREEGLSEENLLYCGGGGFLALVPASEGEQWKERVEKVYLEKTLVATVTVVLSDPLSYLHFARGLEPFDDVSVGGMGGKGLAAWLLESHFGKAPRGKRKVFGEQVAYLGWRLRVEKERRAHFPFFQALPIHRICEACGKRPAGELDPSPDVTPREWLCRPCFIKRARGREERRSLLKKLEDWLKEKGRPPGKELKFARDLDDLAGREGRIAFLYVDGNGVGDLLQGARTPAEFRHLSEALVEGVKEALWEALSRAFPKALGEGGRVPFEVVAVGGDDAVLILPARPAWKVSLYVLREFEEHPAVKKVAQEFGQPLTLSAGLVVADVKHPVRYLEGLSEGLLKEAKRCARERRKASLCHLWLKAPLGAEEAKPLLDALYQRHKRDEHGRDRPEKDRPVFLTARPYTLEEAQTLSRLAKGLQRLPSSQRHALARALEEGVYTSLNLALYQAAKAGELAPELLEVLRGLGELLDKQMEGKLIGEIEEGIYFWRKKLGGWVTGLLDALEVAELFDLEGVS